MFDAYLDLVLRAFHRKPKHIEVEPRTSEVISVGPTTVIIHRIGDERFVWRYNAETVSDAMLTPSLLAAQRGVFTAIDAKMVTRLMLGEALDREAAKRANGV